MRLQELFQAEIGLAPAQELGAGPLGRRRIIAITGGRFSGEYVLSPEGEVVSARVRSSTMPNEDAQACAVAAMRATRFPPPPGEEAGAPKAFGFEFATRAEQERNRR